MARNENVARNGHVKSYATSSAEAEENGASQRRQTADAGHLCQSVCVCFSLIIGSLRHEDQDDEVDFFGIRFRLAHEGIRLLPKSL